MPCVVKGQSAVTTISLGPDQIGKVKTAQGISTRMTFPDPVYEIICGDLYDATSGKGLFVVQGSGDDRQRGNSVYLKPVAGKGMSNLFVTTGEKGKNTYNFDLEIVPIAQAHRVVNVIAPQTPTPPLVTQVPPPNGSQSSTENGTPSGESEARRNELEQQARRQADEILRQARQQADRIVGEAEARVIEADRQALQRGDHEAERRFVRALMLGTRELKVNSTRAAVKKVIVTLDPRIVILGEKAYLRYTIQNTGDQVFTFAAIALERASLTDTQQITVETNQTKAENKLEPSEVMAGVLVFDQRLLAPKDKLTLFLRGEENAELIRVSIQ
jgi:vacuolar-type H+-ATPase subunit H